jgi:hypothetical protein
MARVYVSSTFADLKSHRERVRHALRRRRHEDVAMELYGAEDKRPLEKCLEDVKRCDLYVGIFAFRYGYVPPGQDRSITELEYQTAVDARKSRLLFLLAEDATWPVNLMEMEKYQEQKSLRERVKQDRLVVYFSSEDQLYAEVTDALVRWEQEQGIAAPAPLADWEGYKERLWQEHRWVRLNVIAGPRPEKITQIPLVEVFVPQLAQAKLPVFDLPEAVLLERRRYFQHEGLPDAAEAPAQEIAPESEPAEPGFPEDVLEAIGRERTQVVLGGPGTGKSTLLHYLMLRVCDPYQATDLPRHFQARTIPFLVELRQYLLSRRGSLLDYIVQHINHAYGAATEKVQVEAILNESDRALVFFDGLDEVFDSDDRREVISQFRAFARQYSRARLVVTSRIAGYDPAELALADFKHYTLLDFTIRQIADFLRQWYACYTWPGAERGAQDLVERIVENPRLRELGGNPLLLTMMAIIYRHEDLPERRWQLYQRATGVLLEDWDVKRKLIRRETILSLPPEVRMGKDQKAKLLQRVATYMLEHGERGRELNAIAYKPLMHILAKFLQTEYEQSHGKASDLAREILNHLRERTYVLAEVGEHIYGFVHRTFMEYFAASRILADFNSKESDYHWLTREIFGRHWSRDEWEEVLLLLIAMLADQGSPVGKVVEYLRDHPAPKPPLHLAFAARCLAEANATGLQPLAQDLLTGLASAIEQYVGSRAKGASAFVETGASAFSRLALMVETPQGVARIISVLAQSGKLPIQMVAWQMAFATRGREERLAFALEGLEKPEEAVRRAAVAVLEREWPGNERVRIALLRVVREVRQLRVRQPAIEALQRGWPEDREVLPAIAARLEEEQAYTDVTWTMAFLATHWPGDPEALRLVIRFAGSRVRALDRGMPDVVSEAVDAIKRGWGKSERTLSFLANLRADFEAHPDTADPAPRASIFGILGGLGLDDRPGVGLRADGLPDIDWVEVPGGEFVYRDGERLDLPRFYMARYPITHAQFQTFLEDAEGYGSARWWHDLERSDASAEPPWRAGNHPRVNVSWYEAVAFCRWLSARLGYEVSLPTEEQWEKAARGTDGRRYPWGEEYISGYANVDETWGNVGKQNLGRTSPVGIYPQGASPYGVLDLAGNVWEWCLNEYDKPRIIQPNVSGHRRVVRGGSWDDHPDYAQASFRYGGHHPDGRYDDFGFRVCCAAPIA